MSTNPADRLAPDQRNTLLHLARQSIAHGVAHVRPMTVDIADYPQPLQTQRATFVTLKLNGDLRGCIGTLEAHRPLVEDVIQNAWAAAFSDPRFVPVSADEVGHLHLHISILNPAEPMAFTSEQDLIVQLRPGIDGLILQDDGHRGTFLPSVWESLPAPAQFFQHLKLKAGLPANHWSNTLTVSRYTTTSFGDPE